MLNCKCKDCKNRTIGCHAQCEDYKDYVRRNEQLKEKKKILKDLEKINFKKWRK